MENSFSKKPGDRPTDHPRPVMFLRTVAQTHYKISVLAHNATEFRKIPARRLPPQRPQTAEAPKNNVLSGAKTVIL